MTSFLQDLRFSVRVLAKAPGFTVAAVIVLAVGIGTNTAVFSLVNVLLFRPPAYAKSAEVVQLFSQDKKDPHSFRSFSYPTYKDIQARNTVFSDVMAHNIAIVGIGEKENTRRVFGSTVSSNYFSVLGVAPVRGRAFLPEEETPGRGAQVAVVSYNFWKKRGAEPGLLGSTIEINSRPFTVVGIMPQGFTGTMEVFAPEVWLPLGVYDLVQNDFQSDRHNALADRGNTQLLLVGRLKAGVTAASALPALKTLGANLEAAYPVEQKDQTLLVAPLSRFSTSSNPYNGGDANIAVLGALLIGMAGIVLVVSCLNLASMLLARGTARRKEIAIRLALGGRRGRVIRQLLTEGFVLSVLGGAVGLVLALWSSDLLVASFSRMLPFDIVWSTRLSPIVLVATFGFCVLGTLCFALGPAMRFTRGDLLHDLKEHAGEDVTTKRRWKFLPRHPLVVVQIALSLALVTAAALFVRSARKASNVDLGLRTERNFLVEVDAALGGKSPEAAQPLYDRITERLLTVPGVEKASLSSTVPLGIVNRARRVLRAGIHPAVDAKPSTPAEGLAFIPYANAVGADYFATVGLPLLRGRSFSALEAAGTGRKGLVIIDQTLAQKLWPDGDALGRRLQFPDERPAAGKPGKPGEEFEVIGVVPPTPTDLFDAGRDGTIYFPFATNFQSNAFFHVRFGAGFHGNESMLADSLRRAVRHVDPTLPILSVKTFGQHVDGNVEVWMVRAGAAIFSVFGALALSLAVVGIYGVKAYSVARRTREIGIRLALGAQAGTVQRMILREGAFMLMFGLGGGLVLALALGKILGGMLYHVSGLDPAAIAVATLLLAASALLACWIPARRATRVDPLVALRTE